MNAMSNPIDPRSFLVDGDEDIPHPVDPPWLRPLTTLRVVQPPTIASEPHAVGAEKTLVSLFMTVPELRARIAEAVTPEHFHLPAHRIMWELAFAIHAKGKAIEPSSLIQYLLDSGKLDRIGGASTISDLWGYALTTDGLDNALELVSTKHAARQAICLARKLLQDLEESPDEVVETIGKAAERLKSTADSSSVSTPLLARAYALQYSPFAQPPADEVLMCIGQAPIAARGNLTVLQGKAKVGKSAVVASILGAALRGRFTAKGDTLGIEWTAERHTGSVVHFDTEQSPADWWALVTRAFARSGNKQFLDRLVSIPLVQFNRKERLAILESVVRDQIRKRGTVDLVILDGVADLCVSPNDEEESLDLVSKLMALCHKYAITIICILHENPDSDTGKTRGHLGSELNRKAFANLRIDKDKDGISTLYGTDMRKRDVPKSQGVCFSWNDDEHMHTVIGSARDVEAERNYEKSKRSIDRKRDETKAGLEDIFGDSESMLYSELWPAIMDRFACKERWAKNKISDWMKAKIITKNTDDEYIFNP